MPEEFIISQRLRWLMSSDDDELRERNGAIARLRFAEGEFSTERREWTKGTRYMGMSAAVLAGVSSVAWRA